jgi:hypothetical protein
MVGSSAVSHQGVLGNSWLTVIDTMRLRSDAEQEGQI